MLHRAFISTIISCYIIFFKNSGTLSRTPLFKNLLTQTLMQATHFEFPWFVQRSHTIPELLSRDTCWLLAPRRKSWKSRQLTNTSITSFRHSFSQTRKSWCKNLTYPWIPCVFPSSSQDTSFRCCIELGSGRAHSRCHCPCTVNPRAFKVCVYIIRIGLPTFSKTGPDALLCWHIESMVVRTPCQYSSWRASSLTQGVDRRIGGIRDVLQRSRTLQLEARGILRSSSTHSFLRVESQCIWGTLVVIRSFFRAEMIHTAIFGIWQIPLNTLCTLKGRFRGRLDLASPGIFRAALAVDAVRCHERTRCWQYGIEFLAWLDAVHSHRTVQAHRWLAVAVYAAEIQLGLSVAPGPTPGTLTTLVWCWCLAPVSMPWVSDTFVVYTERRFLAACFYEGRHHFAEDRETVQQCWCV